MPSGGDPWLSVILAVLAFVIVIAGAYYATRFISKKSIGLSRGRYIEIIDRAVLSNDKWLCIVKVGERYYLLSVAPSSVSLIIELTADQITLIDKSDVQEGNASFATYIQAFMKKIGNKTDETDKS
ncbi:MAG: flagellar protein FliO/FliZ [Clostridiales bacterium]|jgi:flagellar protein FliO/FliZ|nr:flagellar protein FliO/FliZ [Clostridiales bacterium]MDK2991625.1 flagellar protein FliO/FliZ [Clostridiales bacterium]